MTKVNLGYGNLCSLFYDATKKYAPEKEVDFYASFMQPDGRVLEAMSGSGRLQIPLLQRGFFVDGVDNSPTMLSRCRTRCVQLGLRADLYEQSLEDLDVPQMYQTVTIAVGSFQLLTDRSKALRALKKIRTHMQKGGSLLIDIFVPELHDKPPETRIARIDQQTVIKLTTRQTFNKQEKRVDGYCCYELIVNGIVQSTENELIAVTWYSDDELTSLLKNAGFEVIAFYDESFRSTGPSRILQSRAVG